MKFGEVPVKESLNSILAHSVRAAGTVLRKGRILNEEDLKTLLKAGVSHVTVAELETGDLCENVAAVQVAEAFKTNSVIVSGGHTGRANLRAARPGVLVIDAEAIHRINAVDEAVTVSTLQPFTAVKNGDVVATVKIITFGVTSDTVRTCIEMADAKPPPILLAPFQNLKVGFIQTTLPGLKNSLIAKASHATTERLAGMALDIGIEKHCEHNSTAISDALTLLSTENCDIALVLGASAIVDRRDVVPTGLISAGGKILHLGLPVDPGNLMLFGQLDKMRVLGVPSSARSTRLHGFDWVLQRMVAGLDVTVRDLTRMGVGGMLKEMPGRPVLRDEDAEPVPAEPYKNKVGAVLLAAGQSRRMGRQNKMTVEIDGRPMVEIAAKALIQSNADPIIVVLGHEPENVKHALEGMPVTFVQNSDFEDGLSTSLRTGIDALPSNCAGAIIALGDMPSVTAEDIDKLIAAFDPNSGQSICVPTHDGKRGNPVLWARRYFSDMVTVSGDVGARHLIGESPDQVCEVPCANPGVLIDLDTPAAVEKHARENLK